jgi:hypothetical protein
MGINGNLHVIWDQSSAKLNPTPANPWLVKGFTSQERMVG